MLPMRVAWFSPLPPNPSGIAAYSWEAVGALAARGWPIDLYAPTLPDRPCPAGVSAYRAVDFVWRHRRQPYDLPVFQLGNSSAHDFLWGYLFRYPGLVVLHDGQVHQARARYLLERWKPRLADYLAELSANHPGIRHDIGHLVAAGYGGTLYSRWPMTRLVIERSRLTAVHAPRLAARLAHDHPRAAVRALRPGVVDPRRTSGSLEAAAAAVRTRYGIPTEAVVVGAFGGLTPEKRLPAILSALTHLPSSGPPVHLLLVGKPYRHYDVEAAIQGHGLADRVHVTGYIDDEAVPAHLAAVDVCVCLRWPSTGETSGFWTRAIGAGRPVITTTLSVHGDLPLCDVRAEASASSDAIGYRIDILAETEELPVALEALVVNADQRTRMGIAARRYWETHHAVDLMADDYERLMTEAAARSGGDVPLPAHLRTTGDELTRTLLRESGMPGLPWEDSGVPPS
jgi:glycosyltransferase involved in cell wall biosynthesis